MTNGIILGLVRRCYYLVLGLTVQLPVVHVANSPVQQKLPNVNYPILRTYPFSVLSLDIPLFYPNPLAKSEYAPYAPQAMYQAGEFFKFNFATRDLAHKATSLPTSFTWNRLSQWLPWMKMGDRPGQLVFTGQGSKIGSPDELNYLLYNTIKNRSPLYMRAPKCVLNTTDMTSWKYFAKYFQEYLQGSLFPIYESKETHPCV